MRPLFAALVLCATPLAAQDAPRVVTDIAPVRAIVAQVMEGVGTPDQIIPTGASPHGYAMRPSEARALSDADLVVWVGPGLTHWLEAPLDTLAGDAQRLTLMAHPGTQSLSMRVAETDDHAHGDDHGHEDHGDVDPHGWLSPANTVLWAGVVAQKLAQLDPDNADIYTRNWNTLRSEMMQLQPELAALLAPHRDAGFVVLHDGFQYFEASFGLEAQAFIVPGTGQTPGPASLRDLRAQLAEHPVACAFTAPQENTGLLETAIEGQETRIVELDPMGDGEMKPATLLRRFGEAMAACLAQR